MSNTGVAIYGPYGPFYKFVLDINGREAVTTTDCKQEGLQWCRRMLETAMATDAPNNSTDILHINLIITIGL
jgi:hypothetical protein